MASGSIDQLNFEVILVDDKFNATIDNLTKLADSLNVKLSSLLEHLGQDGAKNFGKISESVKDTNVHLTKSRDLLSDFAKLTGVAFGAMGVRRFISDMVRVTGEFEVQKMALSSMLKDADRADAIFKDLRADALRSPYTFQDLSKYAKQLTAFNIDADILVDTERRLADVAAGLGVDMGRIILAYGQVKAAGVLKGTELRQFTEAGVPLLQSLADQIVRTEGKAISLGEVFQRISKKEIPFEMVEQAFRDMTSVGGQFYNMQEVLVETLQGKIGKLRDVWQQVLYDVGSGTSLFKDIVDWLTDMVSKLNNMGGTISALIKGVGAYAAILGVASAAQRVIFGVEAIAGFTKLIKQIRTATTVMQGFAVASHMVNTAAFAIGALVAVTYGIVNAVQKANESQRRYNESLQTFDSQLSEELGKLDEMKARLESAEKGTEEYNKAKQEIVQNYGKYHSGLDAEIEKVGSLKSAYDQLTESIKESLRERQYEEFEKEERRIRDEAIEKKIETLSKKLYKQMPRAQAFSLVNQVRTAITEGVDRQDFWAQFTTAAQRQLGPGIIGFIDKVFLEASNRRDEYLRNTQALLKEYGMDDSTFMDENGNVWKAYYETGLIGPTLDYSNGKTTLPPIVDPKAKDDIDAQTEALKKDIEQLRKYKEAYEAFTALVGPQYAKDLTNEAFKNADITDFNFIARIEGLLTQLENIGKKDVADSIRASIGIGEGRDSRKQLEQVQRTANAYRELIRTMTSEDTNVEGKGFWYDLSKVTSDLETKLNKLNLQGQKAKEKLAQINTEDQYQRESVFNAFRAEGWTEQEIQEFWDKWIQGGRGEINAFIKETSDKAKSAARERVSDLAKTYVEEEFFLEGIDFDNLSDKTIGQLRTLKQKLFDVMSRLEINETDQGILASVGIDLERLEGIDLSDTVNNEWLQLLDEGTIKILKLMQATQKADGTMEDFSKKVESAIKKRLKNLDEEEKKVLLQLGRFAVDALSNVIDALGELSEASGNDGLSMLISDLKEASGFIESVLKGFQKGDIIGAVVAGVTSIATGMIKAATETARFNRELAEARREANNLRFEQALSAGVESIFGTNDLRKVDNATEGIKKASAAMKDLQASMPDAFKTKTNFWKRFARGAGFASGIFGGLVGTQIGKYDKHSLQEMAKSLGRDLYDEYDNLNSETLQAILDKYDKLTQADRDWIQSAIDASDNYRKAMEQLDGVIENIIGDISSNAANAIVEQWKTAGNAALDYTDILDDVATKYAQMAVQSLLLDEVFNSSMQDKLRESIKSGRMDDAMDIVADGMETVATLAPQIEQILEPLRPYIKETEGTSTENTLKAGISKELVEGNSSLIASYMNAMRADLSVMRGMQTSGWQDVRLIREAIQNQYAPNYNEYMAQIAANTYDTAQSNNEILSRLRSIITVSTNGGSAVRTTK